MIGTTRRLRGAVYRPAWRLEGRPAAGPDEDAFTLGASALERLLRAAPAGETPPKRLHQVGELPETATWGYAALTGTPLEVVRHEAGAAGFSEAWNAVHSGPALVVTAETPERSEDASAALGAGAVALLADAGPGAPPATGTGNSSVDAALSLRPRAEETGGSWSESEAALPGLELDARRARSFVEADVHGVSQGAYIPRVRYAEGVATHWRLSAERCAHCSQVSFPARGICAYCGRRDGLTASSVPPDDGRVVAATVIGPGGQPTEFDAQVEALGPYGVVLVELEPGVYGTFPVTDADSPGLAIGARVVTHLRRLYPMEGEWRYGRKAAPRPSPADASS